MLVVALLLSLAQAVPPPAPPPATPVPSGPQVELVTSLGKIRLVLDAEKAPVSVENFLRYVREGFYDGTVFHRVMPGFMIQGGGLTPDLQEKGTRPAIRNEARNGLRNSRGTIAMARLNDPNSATAQFFVNVKDNHRLDFGIGGAGYAVFGTVVEGMDVVDRIAGVPTATRGGHQNVPVTPVVLERAREVKGGKPAAPPREAPPPGGKP